MSLKYNIHYERNEVNREIDTLIYILDVLVNVFVFPTYNFVFGIALFSDGKSIFEFRAALKLYKYFQAHILSFHHMTMILKNA